MPRQALSILRPVCSRELIGTLSRRNRKETHQDEPPSQPEPDSAMPVTSPDHPQQLTEAQAVAIAYRAQVKKLATFLRSRLSS